MTTTASKFFFSAGIVALLAAFTYGWGTDGGQLGSLTAGFKGGVGELGGEGAEGCGGDQRGADKGMETHAVCSSGVEAYRNRRVPWYSLGVSTYLIDGSARERAR